MTIVSVEDTNAAPHGPAPDRIWLQLGFGDDGSHTWCEHPITDDESIENVEYVRVSAFDALAAKAARTDALEAEIAALVKERDALIGIAAKYIQTHELHDFTNEVRAQAHDKAAQKPIYQTGFMQGQWRDVDRCEYERAKGLRADLARIVYTASQQAAQEPVGVVDESDDGLFIELLRGPNGNPLKRGDHVYTAPQQASEQRAALHLARHTITLPDEDLIAIWTDARQWDQDRFVVHYGLKLVFVDQVAKAAPIAQPIKVDLPDHVIDSLINCAGVSDYHPDGSQREKLYGLVRTAVAETLARLPSQPSQSFESWFASAWAAFEDKEMCSEIKAKVWALKAYRKFASQSAPVGLTSEMVHVHNDRIEITCGTFERAVKLASDLLAANPVTKAASDGLSDADVAAMRRTFVEALGELDRLGHDGIRERITDCIQRIDRRDGDKEGQS